MEAVKSGKVGTNRAAREFDVPATTLKDRLSGRVKHGSKPGPAPYLTKEEERELAEFFYSSGSTWVRESKARAYLIFYVRPWKKRELILPSSMGKDGGLDSKSDTPGCHLGQLIHFPCLVQIHCLKQPLMHTSTFWRRH